MIRIARRMLLSAALALAGVGPAAAQQSVPMMAADEAHRLAGAGELVLIDIRTPEEWAQSGVPEGAERLSMQDPELGAKLDALLDGDRSKPVALICRTGARSWALASAMAKHGFSEVYSVGEGLMGSMRGPGWLQRGLPVER